MTKLFLIITAAALLAAAVFGWQNRGAFIADREARHKNNKNSDAIISEFEKVKKPELEAAHTALHAAESALAQAKADLEETRSKIATVDAEIGTLKGQMAPLDSELAKAEAAVEELRRKYPDVDLDTLGNTITQAENELEEKKVALATKQTEIEIASKKVAANGNTIERYQKKAAARIAAIKGNGTEGTITAVNNDWGFAVANVGSGIGVNGESSLIVKRGTQRIAELKVVSVQPNKTVLDIRQQSLTGVVQPGDRVIFEKTLD